MRLNQIAPPAVASVPKPPTRPKWVDLELSILRGMKTGQGVHEKIFCVAKGLVPYHTDDEAAAILKEATADCGRYVEADILNAIRDCKAFAFIPAKSGAVPVTPLANRPKILPPAIVDLAKRAEIIGRIGLGLADIEALSPISFDSPEQEAVIDGLFPGDPLLCVGRTDFDFNTMPRSHWWGLLADQQFIVPSPMTARTGLTKAGAKESAHTLSNTGARAYAVIEADDGTEDEQASLIWHLKEELGLPLAMIVFSGRKSLHAWFNCIGVPEEKTAELYRYCRSLGFCGATKTRSQFVRLPFGKRADTGLCQSVHYWNPAAAGVNLVKEAA